MRSTSSPTPSVPGASSASGGSSGRWPSGRSPAWRSPGAPSSSTPTCRARAWSGRPTWRSSSAAPSTRGASTTRIEAAGEEEAIDFAFDRIRRTPNTVASHRLMALAGRTGRQDAVVEALFGAYFLDGEDIGDPATLGRDRGARRPRPGGATDFLAGTRSRDEVLAEDAAARRPASRACPASSSRGATPSPAPSSRKCSTSCSTSRSRAAGARRDGLKAPSGP